MEGPSIVILNEEVRPFKGKNILRVSGNSKIEKERLADQKVLNFKSWGKHFLICFPSFFVRIHFLMFGSYRINEVKDRPSRLTLSFKNGELNFYSCSIKIIEGNVDEIYDWRIDIMSDQWDKSKARRSLKKLPESLISDVLLDQQIFAGVGNIIKNEVLFRVCIHPEAKVGALSSRQLSEVIKAARDYSFDFYKWKKVYQLKKHFLIYRKKKCLNCGGPVTMRHTGLTHRLSFFCEYCQPLAN